MTNEEKEVLEPMIRSIVEKSKGKVTDEDVAKAMEILGTLADNTASIYSYDHPDYGAMIKEVPEPLRQLLDNSDVHDNLLLRRSLKMTRRSSLSLSKTTVFLNHTPTLVLFI